MRPHKHILLLGQDEQRLSLFRYVLRNAKSGGPSSAQYQIASASDVNEAMKSIREREYDSMIILHPFASMTKILQYARITYDWMPIIVLSETLTCGSDLLYDAWLCGASNETILEWVRGMTKKQKGPRKGSPAAYRCGKREIVLRKREVASESPVAQDKEDVA